MSNMTIPFVRQRMFTVSKFSDISKKAIAEEASAILVTGHSDIGVGMAYYVSDSKCTNALLAAHPLFVTRTTNGRIFRLVGDQSGVYPEQAGVIKDDTTKAVSNVTTMKALVAYMSAVGIKVLRVSEGTIHLDNTTLSGGIAPAGDIDIVGNSQAATFKNTNPASDANVIFSIVGNTRIRNVTIQGRVVGQNKTGGGLENCVIIGGLSNEVQYEKVDIDLAALFTSPTFVDETNVTAPNDYTWSKTGSVVSMQLDTNTSIQGQVQYGRYAKSAMFDVDPTKRYVFYFNKGFYTGAGAAVPMIECFDASGNPQSIYMEKMPYTTSTVDNVYQPNATGQGVADNMPGNWQTALIYGVSKIRLTLGGYRTYDTPAGLTATFDLSAITILKLTNDFASWSFSDLPTGKNQTFFYNCVNTSVRDCTFKYVAGYTAGFASCTGCDYTGNRVVTSTGGVSVDDSRQCVVDGNYFDLRFKDTLGTIYSTRAYRWKAINGARVKDCTYRNNKALGASWAYEILPYSTTSRNVFVANEAIYAMCAASLGTGDWVVKSLTGSIVGDGCIGLELPGGTADTTGPLPGYEYAYVDSCTIIWDDFTGYHGVGISCAQAYRQRIRDCYIEAPLMILANGNTDGDGLVTISAVSGRYAMGALQVRQNTEVHASFDRIVAYKPSCTQPLIADASIFSIGSGKYTYRHSISANYVDVGIGKYVLAYGGYKEITVSLKEVVNTGQYRYNQPFRFDMNTSWAQTVRLIDNNITNSPSAGTRAFQIGGTPNASSIFYMKNNRLKETEMGCPGGTYPRNILRGDYRMRAYLTNIVLGTINPYSSIEVPGFTLDGLTYGFQPVTWQFASYLHNGLVDLKLDAYPTAEGVFTLVVRNLKNSAVTPSTQSIVCQAFNVGL
jgi:hypothetical protein